jgi:hypothetical protein
MNLSHVQSPGRALSTDLSLAHGTMPQSAEALIKPLLSGCSFLAMHGYQRRGMELSLSCRFPTHQKNGFMTLEVYPEVARSFDLEGISFRVQIEGERCPARVVSLNRSGTARIDGVERMDRVLLTLESGR